MSSAARRLVGFLVPALRASRAPRVVGCLLKGSANIELIAAIAAGWCYLGMPWPTSGWRNATAARPIRPGCRASVGLHE
jgi:hypothetical protein